SKPDLVANTVYMEPLSDHISINVELFIPSCEQPLRTKTILCYATTNLDAINQHFSLFSAWFLDEFDSRSLNENWFLFKCKLLELCDKFIPKLTIHTSFSNPWFSTRLKRLLNKKNRLFRAAKASQTPISWFKYKECYLTCKYEIKNPKDKFFNYDLCNILKTNPKKFWSAVNLKQVKDSVSLTDASGKRLPTAETCELFCTFFSEVFTDEFLPLPSCCPEYLITTQMDEIIVTNDGISKLISNLPSNSAPGPDLITTKLLKITSDISSVLLSRIFQKSLDSGVVPG
ncbi:uncharacterized protein LOC121835695, partial [Ixodes scapularis]|uniref:uncharacterized protein LOC121835695 n=1 Tax=Ixodes scapularis TaxID=6945 RepID=UPI001C37F620